MMDLLPNYDLGNVTTRHNELLKEAERARLARLATSHQALSTRIFSGVGDMLISSGVSLKQRCQPAENVDYGLFAQTAQRMEI